jgi:hypothetical protein
MTVGKVFLNYRRDDSEGYVGRLYDHLTQRFPGRIFRDVTGLRPGEDFVNALDREGVSCQVLLAVIGRRWLASTDGDGRRRLDDPEDILRKEIVHALGRNVLVVPVLVGGATMPAIEALPQELKPLGRRQALSISELDFEHDLERLMEVVGQELKLPCAPTPLPPAYNLPQGQPPKSRKLLWILGSAAGTFVLLMIIGLMSNQSKQSSGEQSGQSAAAPMPSVAQPASQSTTTELSPQPATQAATQASTQAAALPPPEPRPAPAAAPAASGAAMEWQQHLMSTASAIISWRQHIGELIASRPTTVYDLQSKARQILSALDSYDAQLNNLTAVLNQGMTQGYLVTATDRSQAQALGQACNIWKEQSAKYRYEAQLIAQFNPNSGQGANLQAELASIDSEVATLDLQAAAYLKQAGLQ